MKRRVFLGTSGLTLALAVTAGSVAWAENAKLKIGFVGVTSGPAAAWGISNQRSMETRAAWLNELGGVEIGGTTYDIEIVPFDGACSGGRPGYRDRQGMGKVCVVVR